MMKHRMLQSEIIPGFDVIKWKREIQAQIYEETKDMTSAEAIEYSRQAVLRGERRRAELAKKSEQVTT